MSAPSVVVGVPTHDSELTLEDTLRSLLAQDYERLRVVIRDDASRDHTLELARDLAGGDARVRIVPGATRLGWIGNYNALLDQAEGDYFCFAPHDDVYESGFVGAMVALLEAQPGASLAYSAGWRIDAAGERLGELPDTAPLSGAVPRRTRALRYLWWSEWEKGHLFHGLMRTAALKASGGLRPVRFASDNLCVLAMALRGHLAYDPRPLWSKRIVAGSVSTTYGHRLAEWLEHFRACHVIVDGAGLSRTDAAVLHGAIALRQGRAVGARPFGVLRRRLAAGRSVARLQARPADG